ncbi:hypothetical protein Tco_1305498 [Tanacetum coccineum]
MSNISTFATNYVAYCRNHPAEINNDGIVETARRLGLEDVNTLFDALDTYIKEERDTFKDNIKSKLKGVHVDTAAVVTTTGEDVPDSKKEKYKKVMESKVNIRLVDLIAKEEELKDVARMTGRTEQDLKLAVQKILKLCES